MEQTGRHRWDRQRWFRSPVGNTQKQHSGSKWLGDQVWRSCHGMAERLEVGCELEEKAWEIHGIFHNFSGISGIFGVLCAGMGPGVKPKCGVGVDFMVHRGGPQRVLWESGSLLGLHSYRVQQEVLCTQAAKRVMPRSCGVAGGRPIRPMMSEVHAKSWRISEAESGSGNRPAARCSPDRSRWASTRDVRDHGTESGSWAELGSGCGSLLSTKRAVECYKKC